MLKQSRSEDEEERITCGRHKDHQTLLMTKTFHTPVCLKSQGPTATENISLCVEIKPSSWRSFKRSRSASEAFYELDTNHLQAVLVVFIPPCTLG